MGSKRALKWMIVEIKNNKESGVYVFLTGA